MNSNADTPYLTADLPGVGGRIKVEPGDFVVDEIPVYQPCGEGEHLFLWVEKRDVSAEQLVQHLSRTLRIDRGSIGVAGLKDRRAVTRQFVSVPGSCTERVGEATTEAIRILSSALHRNKLRTGHLAGNRFEIVVRDVAADALPRAEAIATVLRQSGAPNYYGDQRFGREQETLALGLDLLAGRKTERDIPPARRRFLLRLALSSVQSWLFNRVLAERLRDGLLHRVLEGDVMQVVASGGPFVVTDVEREQARYDARDTVLTGPMFGPKMRAPTGEPAEREARVLVDAGLTSETFQRYAKLLPGTRRPLIVHPEGLSVESHPAGLRLTFALPPGAYATVVLREFMKVELTE